MKLTSSQLRKIISEEVSKVITEQDLTPGRLALGSLADISEIEKAKAALDSFRMHIEKNAIAEGHDSEEAEDFARDGLGEMFQEFMQSIGYRM